MKDFSLLIGLLLSLMMNGQVSEVITPLRANPLPERFFPEAAGDTINLPIVDDFSYSTSYPSQKFWMDSKVLVNSTHSRNPLSVGVATFDGLNEEGYPYHPSDNSSDTIADVLTSKYINLTNLNNVYLSFYYQPGGWGEEPEPEDSLVVQFWSPVDSTWEQVWGVEGFNSNNFSAAIIAVDSSKWLQNGFQFRFAAYGARNGSFDVWNIDYVYMEHSRTGNDSIIQDPTFSKPLPGFTRGYEEIPWFHFDVNQQKDTLNTAYRRNGPTPSPPWTLTKNKFTLFKNGAVDLTGNGFLNSNDPHNVDLINPLNIENYDPGAILDSFSLRVTAILPGDKVNPFTTNDTLKGRQAFYNHYAYDDGTAERAYGVENIFGARMAFRFNPLQPDTMKGLFFRFAHGGVDGRNYTFKIGVWQDNAGVPGNLIYLSDSNYVPDYGYNQNSFMPYELDTTGVFINGSVFIGIRQNTDQPIYVGLDMNVRGRTDLYYGSNVSWFQSLSDATLMIHPWFRYQPHNISIPEKENRFAEVQVYPNPSSGKIFVDGAEGMEYRVLDLSGRTVDQGILEHEINLGSVPSGMYLLMLLGEKDNHVEKIIIRH